MVGEAGSRRRDGGREADVPDARVGPSRTRSRWDRPSVAVTRCGRVEVRRERQPRLVRRTHRATDGNPSWQLSRGDPGQPGHRTNTRLGGWVTGGGPAWRHGEPEPERARKRPERWIGATERESEPRTRTDRKPLARTPHPPRSTAGVARPSRANTTWGAGTPTPGA
jgi:hypothetical protein